MTTLAESQPGANATTVALVEDDARTRNLIADLLRRAGFVCTASCANAEVAQRVLVEAPPDIVLMDITCRAPAGSSVCARSNRGWPARIS